MNLTGLLCFGLLYSGSFAADMRSLQRPTQTLAPAAKVEVKSIDPVVIQLEPGKASVVATVKGSGLDRITQVAIVLGGQVVREIEVTLGSPSASARQITLKAGGSARPGKHQVRVIAGTQTIDVPLIVAGVEVKASPSQQPSATTVPASKPIVVTTEKLTVTIKPPLTASSLSQPVNITTEKLTVTIRPSLTALSPSQPIVATTEKLTVTVKPPLQPTSP